MTAPISSTPVARPGPGAGRNFRGGLRRSLSSIESLLGLSRWLAGHRNAILVYHAIETPDAYGNVSASRFRRDLEFLDDRFEVVDLPAALTHPTTGGKRVAVTIDDGYRSVHTHALPIARELSVPLTVFVPVGFVGGDRAEFTYRFHTSPAGKSAFNDPSSRQQVDRPPPTFLSEQQLGELVDEKLVCIGAHTRMHPDLAELSDPSTARSEIRDARAELEALIDDSVDRFSFPYGRYDDRALSIVRRTYDLAVTSREGLLDPSPDRYQLPRLRAHLPEPELKLKLADPYWPVAEYVG